MKLLAVENAALLKKFIRFPHTLYKGHMYYAPEFNIAVAEKLNPKKNPYFKHSEAQLFLVEDENHQIVGRIAVTINNNYNKHHDTRAAWFGFFDCFDDQNVCQLLFDAVSNYCIGKDVDTLMGPANFTTNDTAALLVEGFDAPPVIQMTYNYPYYEALLLKQGFRIEMNLGAYYIPTSSVNDRSISLERKLSDRLAKNNITVRQIRKANWSEEVAKVSAIYQSAWQKNWGFVPPTKEEFDFLAGELRLVIDERFAFIAEQDGQAVGFLLAIPDINEFMVKSKNGKLDPGIIFNILFRKNRIKNLRVILLGVLEPYRKLGIEAVFFSRIIQQARKFGITGGEASWVLESNKEMSASAEKLNGRLYKNYRIYSKKLQQ